MRTNGQPERNEDDGAMRDFFDILLREPRGALRDAATLAGLAGTLVALLHVPMI